jgi:hypothetical protein
VNAPANGAWFDCLPSCETQVPCGTGRHAVRWEAGSLLLPSHADVEAELVLAALGGEKARCVEAAQAWERHADDLSVLAIGPRGPADQIAVDWDDVLAAKQRGSTVAGPLGGPVGGARTKPMRPASQPGSASQPGPSLPRGGTRQRKVPEERIAAQRRRDDLLSLLALGYGFQVRLSGQVAATHAARLAAAHAARGGGEQAGSGPALVAAITGRLAPVAEEWLGIDPDQVVVSLHSVPGWGSAELTGRGADRRLRVSLPAGWLASVWACGLARIGRHLIVAVQEPGWPAARVLGLRAPGAEPEQLDAHADEGGPADAPHWEI